MLIQIKKLYDKTFGYLFYSFYDRYDNYWTDGLAYVQATGYVAIVKFLLIFMLAWIIGEPAFVVIKQVGRVSIIPVIFLLFIITYYLNKKNVNNIKTERIKTVYIILIPFILFFISIFMNYIKKIITNFNMSVI